MHFTRQLLLANLLLLGIVFFVPGRSSFAADAGAAAAVIDAGAVAASDASIVAPDAAAAAPAPAPATIAPVDPATVSIDDLASARRQGWAAIFFVLVLLAIKLLPSALPAVPQLAFLEQGKNAVILAAVAAGCAGGYNALALHGAWTAIAVAAIAAALAHIDFGSKPSTPAA